MNTLSVLWRIAVLGGCLAAPAEYRLSCQSTTWNTHNAVVECGSIGGKDGLYVQDKGGYSHVWRELPVQAGTVYEVTGMFYAEKAGLCDDSLAALSSGPAPVKWCSPAVVSLTSPFF